MSTQEKGDKITPNWKCLIGPETEGIEKLTNRCIMFVKDLGTHVTLKKF